MQNEKLKLTWGMTTRTLIEVTVRPITLSSIKQIALDLNLRYYNRESSFYIPSISHRLDCISMHSFNMSLYYAETRSADSTLRIWILWSWILDDLLKIEPNFQLLKILFYSLNIAKFDIWPPSIRTYEELQKHVS